MRSARLSIVVPVLDEAGVIADTLGALQDHRRRGHEVIVVDGGSTDASVALAAPLADKVLCGARGRARQMNAGARVAGGGILLFLHADTVLPPDADRLVVAALAGQPLGWGRFDLRLSGRHPLLRVIERAITLRSAWSGVATGDQAIFLTRALFERVGGFDDIPLMEDVALSRKLLRHGRPHRVRAAAVTSSRRWEERGMLRTILLMWRLRLAYFLGADPRRLARTYHKPARPS